MPLQAVNARIELLNNPGSEAAEAYRSLRIHLDYATGNMKSKTIAITSVQRGEGKTTSAINLAVAYAQAGKKVALIDTNMRSAAPNFFFRDVGETNRIGLIGLLATELAVEGNLESTSIPHLSFLPAGGTSLHAAELLASGRMDDLLEQLKRRFDVIVLDTAAIESSIDAKVAAMKSDGVVVVVEHSKVKRSKARLAGRELKQVGANVLGVIVNKIGQSEAKAYFG